MRYMTLLSVTAGIEITVYTHFWVDNFDVLVDREMVLVMLCTHNTSDGCVSNNSQISVNGSKTRHLFFENVSIDTIPVDKTKKPTYVFSITVNEVDEASFNRFHFVWAYLRKSNPYGRT